MKSPNEKKPARAKTAERRQILLHLDSQLIRDLKKMAIDLGTSASAIANTAIEEWLKETKKRQDGKK
jgi:hypothetical protein